jgi:threonine/homoserine/homoserine lactone efflux protein
MQEKSVCEQIRRLADSECVKMMGFLSSAFAISLTGAMSPGPLTTLAITEGARRGRWAGWWLSAGHGLVEGVLVVAIGLGLEGFLRQPAVGAVIGIVGGLFLAWMGWGLVSGAWSGRLSLGAAATAEAPAVARLGLIPAGAALSLSNPYWSLWWASVGAGLILTALEWGALGLTVFFLVHWSTDFLWLNLVSFLTASGRGLINERVYRAMLIACGLFLLGFSAYFIIAGLRFAGQIGG